MLNLEWVTRKLLPSVISRTPIGKKKQQQNSGGSSAGSPSSAADSAATSPSPQRTTLDVDNNNTDPQYLGPKPASVVPPHIFSAILDEAITVLLQQDGNSAFQELCVDDACFDDEDILYRQASEEVLGVQGGATAAAASGDKSSHLPSSASSQKVVVVGPTRGHSVPLARLLLSWLSQSSSSLPPHFVFLGDYIDSGPCSIETVAIVLSLLVACHRERQGKAPRPPSFSSPSSQVSSALVSPKMTAVNPAAAGGASSPAAVNLGSPAAAFSPASRSIATPPLAPTTAGGMMRAANNNSSGSGNELGPQVVLLRGRFEANFPAPVKWTGSPIVGYRRLDDELAATFTDDLDSTGHSLVAVLQKLRQVFALLPVAAMVRCRTRGGEATSFLCVPGGPSPALLRHSSLREMKECVEGAALRVLRAPYLIKSSNSKNSSNNNNSAGSSPGAAGCTPPPPLPPTAADEQLLKDLASAEPYEDDEDRAATTAGILFSDNPDTSRDPGMCCFSTEAAATLLARCGAQCLIRGNGYSLQKIAVPRSLVAAAENKVAAAASSSEPASLSATQTVSSKSSSGSETVWLTGRPRASAYDPGYRMYRLPNHVKRAVQSGGIPGSQASPLSMSPSGGSVVDLVGLAAAAGGSFETVVSDEDLAGSEQLMMQQQQQEGTILLDSEDSKTTTTVATATMLPRHIKKQLAANEREQKQKLQQQQKTLPQILSLFSAPHFGSNFKSRNLGAVAVIQCGEALQIEEENNNNNNGSASQTPEQVALRLSERVAARQRNRTVLMSVVQFTDPEPLLFTPADSTEKRLRDMKEDFFDDNGNLHSDMSNNKAAHEGSPIDGEEDGEAKKKKEVSVLDMVQLDDAERAMLRRVRRLCGALKERGQLGVVSFKQRDKAPAAAADEIKLE